MLELVLSSLISVLLLTGCYTDMKWYHVSNRVTYPIALLCIPLITFSNQLIYAQAGFSLFLLAAWYFNQTGAADVKVLVPLLFTFNDLFFLTFLAIMAFAGLLLFISHRKAIPLFIPITAAYLVTAFLKYVIL